MMRWIILACLTLLVLSLVAFTRAGREPRADFTYVNPSGIHTLDPARMSWTQDFRVALNIWEGLTTWDAKTTAPMEGAAYFPPQVSSDRLTYTFTIRKDARWSNGDRVKAQDFVRGWRRAIEPGTAADYAFLITDYLDGAAECATWRLQTVADLRAARAAKDEARATVIRSQAAKDFDDCFEIAEGGASNEAGMPVRKSAPLYAQDDRTLVVRLRRPCPFFLDLTAFPTFLPVHESIELLRERHEGLPFNAEGLVVYDAQWTKPDYHANGYPGLITNGAYSLTEWRFKRRARLSINPYHPMGLRAGCKTVDMLEFDNISASIMAYESGDVDFLTDLSVPYEHELVRLSKSGERADFKPCTVLATYFFLFNCTSNEIDGRANPFLDARVRRAFALATDKSRIVVHVLKRGDRVAHSLVPPDAIPGYSPPDGLKRDVRAAKQLLADAGYTDAASFPPVELLYSPSDERVCQAMARTWEQELGVRVELRAKETKTYAEDKAGHRFMIARGSWYADYNDPTTFLNILSTGNGNNDSGYSNARYDALLRKADDTVDPAVRMGILRDAEALVVEEDLPILPILHRVETIAVKPYVNGIYPNSRLWFPFHQVRLER